MALNPITPTDLPYWDDDKPHEECGVFGLFGHDDAAELVALGLHALQHRGQEAAGIVSFDGERFNAERRLGLVGDNFSSEAVIERLRGHAAIGHNRYSTAGDTGLRNVQPLFADLAGGGMAVAHNGNLTNAVTLRKRLVQEGAIFQSTSDTETLVHLVATSREKRLVERLVDALNQIEGAYSLVALTTKKMIGVRDPLGVRPLVLGQFNNSYVLASETCALDIIGARFVRDVEPGEMIIITKDGVESLSPFAPSPRRFCVFEYIYFARPDSLVEGENVYAARRRIGEVLAQESPVDADLVVPIPDSGTPAAIGYATSAGIPFELGIIRNHYVGRTFIEPRQHIRRLGVKLKHNANRQSVAGKRIILVDDSIVRGTTSVKIVQMMREAGAVEVHMRVACPPHKDSCYYGVDTPERDQLLADKRNVDQMCEMIGADSLAFISIDGLYRAMGFPKRDNDSPQYCDACFTSAYPTRLTDQEEPPSETQLSLLTEGI